MCNQVYMYASFPVFEIPFYMLFVLTTDNNGSLSMREAVKK